MRSARIAVLDVGSVKRRALGWAIMDLDQSGSAVPAAVEQSAGCDLGEFANALRGSVLGGRDVALGFECPTFVPVPREASTINSPRSGEPRDRGFAAGAGAASLVTGLVETTWVLRALADLNVRATVDPNRWLDGGSVLLWEPFVSKLGKSGADSRMLPPGWPAESAGLHTRDAATAAVAFAGRDGLAAGSSHIGACGHPFFNTLVAAGLRAGVTIDVSELEKPCFVVKARD